MFNVRRYDPAEQEQNAASDAPNEGQQLELLRAKIASRQKAKEKKESRTTETSKKRTAEQAFTPATSTVEVGETGWKPAPGESPAEREKRIKREKRAARLAELGLAPDTATVTPTADAKRAVSFSEDRNQVHVLPEPDDADQTAAGPSVHPSRAAIVPQKKSSNAQALTPARKKYLKRKKDRSKAKKKGSKQSTGSNDGLSQATVSDDDDDSNDAESVVSTTKEDEKKKREIILQKKEERRRKRLEKKAAARAIKNGEPVPTPGDAIKADQTIPAVEVPAETKEQARDMASSIQDAEQEQRAENKRAKKEEKQLKKARKYIQTPSPQLIPTEPAKSVAASEIDGPPSETAALLQLPAPKKRAKSNVVLPVHEAVKHKISVSPSASVSIVDAQSGLSLSQRAADRLSAMKITEAFAVQTAVWPILMAPEAFAPTKSMRPQRDLCVAAPTGSGKTLAYVVPIVEALRSRVITRLRALVILPTRDLVSQVRETFETYGKGTGLRVATATGAHSFAQEQSNIVGEPEDPTDKSASQADILVCTPGRLMDHLRSTPRFTLQHLQFLVVDEADRLTSQSFQDWLPTVLEAVEPQMSAPKMSSQLKDSQIMASTWLEVVRPLGSELARPIFSACRKMLFSATLSRDPAKIDALKLHRPLFIAIEDERPDEQAVTTTTTTDDFTFPETLSEHVVISPASHKPLYLLHLLHTQRITSALCFTRSVDAANRLSRLVEHFESALEPPDTRRTVALYSSELAPSERARVLASFKSGSISMLICSDIISRGIDLPSVSHVISYDVPVDMRSYVHRVGRTARAGKKGDAWSLVEEQEVAPFKSLMRKNGGGGHWDKLKLGRVKIKDREIGADFVRTFENAMDAYRRELNKE